MSARGEGIVGSVLALFGLRTTAQKAAWAAQAVWNISYSSGSASADGLTSGTPVTEAEFRRRTSGLVPTVSGRIHVIYLDAPNTAVLHVDYAVIPVGCYVHLEGTPTSAGVTGTVAAWAQPVTTYNAATSYRATTGQDLSAHVGKRMRNTTAGARLGVCITILHDALAGTQDVGPAYAPSDPTFAVFGALPFQGGDTFVVESCMQVADIQCAAKISNPSASDGVFTRLYITNFYISPAAAGSYISLSSGGVGPTIVNCVLGTISAFETGTLFIGCRFTSTILGDGNGLELFGCTFDKFDNSGFAPRINGCRTLDMVDVICWGVGFSISECSFIFLDGFIGAFSSSVVLSVGQRTLVVLSATTGFIFGLANYGVLVGAASGIAVGTPANMTAFGSAGDFAVNDGSSRTFMWADWIASGASFTDAVDGSFIAKNGIIGPNVNVSSMSFAKVTVDKTSLAATSFTDVPIDGASGIMALTVAVPVACHLDVDFRACVTATTAGATFELLQNGSVVGACSVGIGGPLSTGLHEKLAVAAGSTTVSVKYKVGAGGNLAIRPVTAPEASSLSVTVIP